jgi:ornithine decarboxylase
LRIKTNDSKAKWALSEKFGATMDTARRLIDLSTQLSIRLVGVAFHVGCSNSQPSFEEEINKCRVLFDYAKEKYSIEMSIVDLGGGNYI